MELSEHGAKLSTYTYIYIYTYIHIHNTYECTYIYTYIYIHTHTNVKRAISVRPLTHTGVTSRILSLSLSNTRPVRILATQVLYLVLIFYRSSLSHSHCYYVAIVFLSTNIWREETNHRPSMCVCVICYNTQTYYICTIEESEIKNKFKF